MEVFGHPLKDAEPIGVVDKNGEVRAIPEAGTVA